MSDLILEALTNAAARPDDPNVSAAYRQLAHVIGVTLTGEPLADTPLTGTQMIFLRNALRRLTPTQLTPLHAAADQVLQATTTVQITGNTIVNQRIETVSGGNVNMIGISNNNATPGDTQPKPRAKLIQAAMRSEAAQVEWAHDVFISYSRHDAAWARRVYGDLRAAGLLVWMDDQLTPGTQSWQMALEKAIRAAGCVVVLLSPSAKGSEWVEREISFAQTHHRPIVPLLTDGDDRTAVPLALCNVQWTPIRDNREYRANLARIVTAIRSFNP